MNDFNFFAVIDYELIKQHNQNLRDKGIVLKGRYSNAMLIRNELVNTFFDEMLNDKKSKWHRKYLATIKKFSNHKPPCQSFTCDNYDLFFKDNCSLDKKAECLDNDDKFYKGKHEYLKELKRKKRGLV